MILAAADNMGAPSASDEYFLHAPPARLYFCFVKPPIHSSLHIFIVIVIVIVIVVIVIIIIIIIIIIIFTISVIGVRIIIREARR